jgi:hypothetical protein
MNYWPRCRFEGESMTMYYKDPPQRIIKKTKIDHIIFLSSFYKMFYIL